MMKKILILILVLQTLPIFASLYRPFRSLKTYSTKHFEWIFPTESQDTALSVAKKAESYYSNINQNLEASADLKIPVAVTPDSEVLNGYFTPLPQNRIALYDITPEVNSSLANVKGEGDVFFHELTHAVSLNIRSPFWQVLSGLFGDFISPQGWIIPMWMVEGVTVSFESLSGSGRVNDPWIQARLIEDASEGRFFRLDQLTGVYDGYRGSAFYEYGGYFNHYLQKKYGMHYYADLWRKTGDGNIFGGFSDAFRRTYAVPLEWEWGIFRHKFQKKLPQNPHRLKFYSSSVSYLRSTQKGLYYLDAREGGIFYLNPVTRRQKLVLENPSILSFDINPQGDRMLVTLRIAIKGGVRVATREYSLRRHTWVGHEFSGLREAVYAADGSWLAIRVHGQKTDLVRVKGQSVKVIREGQNGEVIGNPVSFDGRILALVRKDGIRYLCALKDGEWNVFKTASDDLRWVRYLQAKEGKLLFSSIGKECLPVLAKLQGNEVTRANTVLGGVFYPTEWKDRVFYVAHFRDGTAIMEQPTHVVWQSLGSLNSEMLDFADGHTNTASLVTIRDKNKIKDYFPLKYLNPFSSWYPFPVLGYELQNGKKLLSIEGLGMWSYMQDPAESFIWQIVLGYDWKYSFALINTSLKLSVLPVDVTLSAADVLQPSGGTNYRLSGGGVNFGLEGAAGWNNLPWSLQAGVSYLQRTSGSGTNAYLWPLVNNALFWDVTGNVGSLHRGGRYKDLWGNTVFLDVSQDVVSSHWRVEGGWTTALRVIPFKANIWGGWSDASLFYADGTMQLFGKGRLDFPAYHWLTHTFSSYIAAEANLLVFNFEVQRQAWIFPLYLRRLSGVVGYRTFWDISNGKPYRSAFADLTPALAFPIGAIGSATFTDLTIEGQYAFDASDPAKPWSWNIKFNAQF